LSKNPYKTSSFINSKASANANDHIFQEVLANGITFIHQTTPYSEVAHCGILIMAGTRNELPGEEGYAHFLEHLLFKGTTKRKPYHILNRIDAVGGEINAYTSKEETFLHCSFLSNYYERAVELLADLVQHSLFPEKEIEKEKEVIIDEIDSYLDSPGEQIFDDFEALIFRGNGLGNQILGTKKSIKSANRKKLMAFYNREYHINKMVFSSVGNINPEKLKMLLLKYFPTTEGDTAKTGKTPFVQMPAVHEVLRKNINQCHCILGAYAYPATHDKRRTLALVTNILGGPGLNSRLNMNVREKHGLTYNLEANYNMYSDTGLFHIYFGTDLKNFERSKQLILKELELMKNQKLGTLQLHSAKQQLIGQLALANESKLGVMMSLAKSKANFEQVDSLQEVFNSIQKITANEILEVANEVFDINQMSSLSVLPKR
jgi:predicted Zn-dependent peptidase